MPESQTDKNAHQENRPRGLRSPLRTWGINLFLILVSLAIALLVSEAILRVLFPIKENEGKLLEDLPGDPIQYRLIPGTQAIYYGAPVRVNRIGYRGEALSDATSEQDLRVVVLGDSMTFGNGVRDEETYPAQLERWLGERAEGWTPHCANLGVPSYNTEQVAIQLERMGLPLHPDLVVYGFFVNDAAPKGTSIVWARPDPGWFQSLTEGAYLIRFLQNQVPRLVTSVRKGLGIRARSDGYIDYYQEGSATWEACRTALRTLRDRCREEQVPLAVALIPFWVEFDRYPWQDCHRIVREELEHLGVPCIDLARVWGEKGIDGRDYWIDIHQSHPTGDGYRLLVETLGPFLTEEVWPRSNLEKEFPILSPE